MMDEVVNHDQCVRGFTDVFGQFLKNEYQMQPDEDGKIFDLRTLPLEKLSQFGTSNDV